MATPTRIMPPVVFLSGLAAMVALNFLWPLTRVAVWPWRWLGLVPAALGVVLDLWADGLFKRHGTEVKPFRESSALVTAGPYRFSRNPMYLGGALMLAGVALLLGSLTPWLVVAALVWPITRLYIVAEEAALRRRFPDAYPAYARRVRRWL